MDPTVFSNLMKEAAGDVFGELFSVADLPRAHVLEFLKHISLKFLKHPAVTALFSQILGKLFNLGKNVQNVNAYASMIQIFQKTIPNRKSVFSIFGKYWMLHSSRRYLH